jgi:hypothetical protein
MGASIMVGLWNRQSGGQTSLTPPGVGAGVSNEQLSMFSNAAQSSGLTDMGMGMLDQATNGMKNEDQVQMLYNLMATHPNEVALFHLEYPHYMSEFAGLISLLIRKELYSWFSSGVMNASLNAEKAASEGYSTITQENIDAQIAKVIPAQEMQQKVNSADMQAMNMMNGHSQMQQQQMYNQQMQQQQMYGQQQMYNQQVQPPQRPGMGGALGSFGSSLIRGSLGLPPAQQYPQQGMRPQ